MPACGRQDGVIVGEFAADILVEQAVLVELKAVKALDEIHMAQCINYLKGNRTPYLLADQFRQAKA